MKLTVFGATGASGTSVVELGLTQGHDVVAAVRRPAAVEPRDRLVIEPCDVLDASAVAAVIRDADAVICTVGPASNRRPGTLISTGVRNLVAGCVSGGVTRFVFESGLLVGDGHELSIPGRLEARMAGLFYARLKADKKIAEATIAASTLDWVIVRPPNLTHGPATGDYIAGPAARVTPARAISHADCAAVLLMAATEAQWTRQIVNVGRR